jgi:thioredoxin 1
MPGLLQSLFGKTKEPEAAAAAPAGGTAGVEAQAVEQVQADASDAEPVHVSDDTFEEVILNGPFPALVDFWAPWCGPCRMVAPIVEELAKTYGGRALIAKMNTDENMKTASELDIMGIPTLILFKDGREVDRVVGFAPRQTLEEKLQALLN